MFKVYEGYTFGEGFDCDSEHFSPTEALEEAEGKAAASVVLQQVDGCFTLLYVVRKGKVFNVLTGEYS